MVIPIYVPAAKIEDEEVQPCSKGPSEMSRRCLWDKGGIDELLTVSSADCGTFWFSAAQALPAKPDTFPSLSEQFRTTT